MKEVSKEQDKYLIVKKEIIVKHKKAKWMFLPIKNTQTNQQFILKSHYKVFMVKGKIMSLLEITDSTQTTIWN